LTFYVNYFKFHFVDSMRFFSLEKNYEAKKKGVKMKSTEIERREFLNTIKMMLNDKFNTEKTIYEYIIYKIEKLEK